MFDPNKHLNQGNSDSTQLDLLHELYTILSHTGISTFFKKGSIYNIYSFTLNNILTSFAEPDAPGSCLVHSGPAFHASVSPQSQNPPPVELCICKNHVFQSQNMHIKSKRKIEMCIEVKHKYKYLQNRRVTAQPTDLTQLFFFFFFKIKGDFSEDREGGAGNISFLSRK